MRILTVFAHPRRDSYTGAVLDAFHAGLEEVGHTWELVDLYRQDFDPRLKPADYVQFTEGAAHMPADVLAEQARVERADAVALVFPVWWWSFPAILKGWFDRVWCQGWAYDFTVARSTGLLQLDKVVLLCPGGSSADVYRRYGYQEGMRRCIDVGVLGYCGIDRVEMHVFPSVDDDAEARAVYLDIANRVGREVADKEAIVDLVSVSQVERRD